MVDRFMCQERVQDGLLRGLRSRLEERRHVVVGHHLQRHGRRWRGEPGARDAAVPRGEGEEDVATPVVEATPHPAEADARTHRDTVALSRQERRVGGQHHDYGTRPRRPGLRLVLERRRDDLGTKHTSYRCAVHSQHGAAPVVSLHERADRPAALPLRKSARSRADTAFELVTDHTRPPSDRALLDGPTTSGIERFEYVIRRDVLAVDIVQGAVVGLGHHGETPVLLVVCAGFDLGPYQGVAYDSDAVGVGDRDRCRQDAGLSDPLQPRHLPVAVEPVRAREDGLVAGKPLAGTDYRNAGPHWPLSDDERPFAAYDGRVPYSHALDVDDRIANARREIPEPYSQLAGAHASSAAQGEGTVHLFVGELEIEDVEVLPQVLLTGRLGDGTDFVLLQEPAQGHLRRRLVVRLSYLPEGLVLLDAAAGEGRVGGQQVVHLLRLFEECVLTPVGMVLDLVAEDLHVLGRLFDQRRGEIAHPDVRYATLILQFSHGPEGLAERHAIARPVHQQQVDVFGAELLQALPSLPYDAVMGEVARPDLGGQEDLLPVYPRIFDATPDLGLVAVHLGCIHVPVTHGKGSPDGPYARLSRKPVSASPGRGTLAFLILRYS